GAVQPHVTPQTLVVPPNPAAGKQNDAAKLSSQIAPAVATGPVSGTKRLPASASAAKPQTVNAANASPQANGQKAKAESSQELLPEMELNPYGKP
ncbi:MAG: hypothetical protein WCK86_13435, partial [Planctomycetia bacterium]